MNTDVSKINAYRMPGGYYTSTWPITAVNSFIGSSKPSVKVFNNDVYSFANTPLIYEISAANTPTVSAASLSDNTVTMTVTVPDEYKEYTKMEVNVGNANCVIISATATDVTCTMPSVAGGATAAEGGKQIPQLYVPGFGFSTTTLT